jgi:biopolymer transport protein TolR
VAMSSNSGGRGPVSDINVTPLVDVMLVLLVIFMVTAPLIEQGVKVDLPKTKAPSLDKDQSKLVMAVTKERRIFIGEAEIPYASLKDRLSNNERIKREKELYLHADRTLPYGYVVDIMAIIKDSGVENLGMVTDPTSPAK